MWSSELGGYKVPLIGDNVEVINVADKRAKGGYLRPEAERLVLTGLRRFGEASLYFERLNPDGFWVPCPSLCVSTTYRPINITSRICGPPPWRPPSRVITTT